MHSFSFYLKKGNELSKLVFRNKSFFEKLILVFYFLGSLLGRLIFFIRPVFLIGDQNIGLMLNEGHDIEVNKIFEGVNDKKRYSGLLVSSLFIDGLCVGLALITVLPFFLTALLASTPSVNVAFSIAMYVAIAFIVVLFVALCIIYAPMGFVAAKGANLSSGDILYLSQKASKGSKGKMIGIYLIRFIPFLIVYGLIIFLAFVFNNLAMNVNEYMGFVVIPLILLIPILEIFLLVRFKVALVASLYALYSDAVEIKHIVIARRSASATEEYSALFTDDMEGE